MLDIIAVRKHINADIILKFVSISELLKLYNLLASFVNLEAYSMLILVQNSNVGFIVLLSTLLFVYSRRALANIWDKF